MVHGKYNSRLYYTSTFNRAHLKNDRLQCVAVCCSVLQCVAVCCSVLQCAAVCCSVLQCAAVCCSVLQCAASIFKCAQMSDICTLKKSPQPYGVCTLHIHFWRMGSLRNKRAHFQRICSARNKHILIRDWSQIRDENVFLPKDVFSRHKPTYFCGMCSPRKGISGS